MSPKPQFESASMLTALIWGEWLFIFRDLGSTGNYFRGAWEQAHSFGDLGSPAKKQKNKRKASILFDFLKISSASGGIFFFRDLGSTGNNLGELGSKLIVLGI